MTQKLLDPPSAAAMLNVSERELRDLRARGAIAFHRLGHRTVRFTADDLSAFLDRCRQGAVTEPRMAVRL